MRAIADVLPAVVWTLMSGAILTAGDVLLRSWLASRWPHGFVVAFSVYLVGVLGMMMSFSQQNIAIATILAVITNAIGYLLIANWFWGDTISWQQGVGIGTGLLAFAILELA